MVKLPDKLNFGYHTMPELYEYRMFYNALLFNEWAKNGTYPVVKSWHHSDGEDARTAYPA